ncbi:DUF2190 family protein [Candidatus Tokpelaia sp.]|uniref:DUF2190 family protein n=1 Tax=Candidatus Tokpelaia sp. TaxID=2233777 RepID=UPI001238F9B3|nr:DUF2190 family protein [Candidatus Tokpelaia sp.]KAA6405662.1 hypothetical protein DPQ22_03090 [Candidatus Tokpelaia sp.]
MTTPILTKAFRAGEKISGFLIVKANEDGTVGLAKAKTDKILGAANAVGAESGDMLDIDQAGWSEVRCGANVAFGDLLTSDANSCAVVAAAGDRILGVAIKDGAAGDVIPFRVM